VFICIYLILASCDRLLAKLLKVIHTILAVSAILFRFSPLPFFLFGGDQAVERTLLAARKVNGRLLALGDSFGNKNVLSGRT